MAVSFNHHDKESWYFGAMSRQEATDLLMTEREGGIFLVRDSGSIQGDYVLCVREESKVSHYIINKIQQGEQVRYRIGDQMFNDIPALLNFYKLHYLDTTPLNRPAQKKVERVMAKYDFDGNDPDDLPFRKGEVMTVVSKDEEQWWTAKNAHGQTGSIPVPYIAKVTAGFANGTDSSTQENGRRLAAAADPSSAHFDATSDRASPPPSSGHCQQQEAGKHFQVKTPSNIQRKLPAYARVKQSRVPNAYDSSALRLEVGDIVKVTKMSINGQWQGETNGRVGHFPFTHVEFIDDLDAGGAES